MTRATLRRLYGVLQSRLHEVWALRLGTRLETRPRCTATTCFETFPFREPTEEQKETIPSAAKEVDRLRNNWLNPPEWIKEEVLEFPGSVGETGETGTDGNGTNLRPGQHSTAPRGRQSIAQRR